MTEDGGVLCRECSLELNICAVCRVDLDNYQITPEKIQECLNEALECLESYRFLEIHRPEQWREMCREHEEYVKWSEKLLVAKIN